MRETIRVICDNCKYEFIAPKAVKCPKCKSHNLRVVEVYIEKAPLQ